MLPNFLVIGAQKAASSWLAEMLEQHPDIYMWRTEIHFFNARFDRGVSWYERHFDGWSGEARVGEKSPLYLSDPQSPQRIHSVLGEDVRLIASLRHPVDRAYSAYWHSLKNNLIAPSTDFVTALQELPDLRANSEYGKQIERYMKLFGSDCLLVQVFEEFSDDRTGALEQCLEFLDVDPSRLDVDAERRVNVSRELRRYSAPAYRISRRLNRLPDPVRAPLKRLGRLLFRAFPVEREYERLAPSLRAELMESFLPDVEHLEDLLNRELVVWREVQE